MLKRGASQKELGHADTEKRVRPSSLRVLYVGRSRSEGYTVVNGRIAPRVKLGKTKDGPGQEIWSGRPGQVDHHITKCWRNKVGLWG